MENQTQKKYVPWYGKVGYACGLGANQWVMAIFTSFALLYLTSIVGLNSAIVGTLMLVSKIFDGVSDLFFGYLIDRTHSKMGKARPWVLGGSFPLAVCLILLFAVPARMGMTAQYVYVFIIYTVLNAICYTITQISVNTMSSLVTKNGNERVNMNSIGYIVGSLCSMVPMMLMLNIVNAFGGGNRGWRNAAILLAAIACALLVICALTCKEMPEEELKDVQDEEAAKNTLPFGQSLKYTFTNKFFWAILMTMLIFVFFTTFLTGTMSYYAEYTLQNENMVTVISMGMFIPVIIALLIVPSLNKRFGLYKSVFIPMIICCVFSVCMTIAGFMNGARAVTFVMVFHIIRCFFFGPWSGLQLPFMSQVANYSVLKNDAHIEGTIFSCTSIASKVGSGVGTWLLGVLLNRTGYVSGTEIQSAQAASNIGLLFTLVPTLFLIGCTIAMAFLRVEKANRKLIEKRIADGTLPESMKNEAEFSQAIKEIEAEQAAKNGASANDGKQ